MSLPNPSLHGLGIQPWRSTPPPGRSSPSPRRWSPSPRRGSPSLRRWSPSPRRLSPIAARGSTPFSGTLGFQPWQSAGVRSVLKETKLVSMTPRKEAGGVGFRSTAKATTIWTKAFEVQIEEADGRFGKLKPCRENLLSFFRGAKSLAGSVSVVSAGARFHRISCWIGNLVLPFEVVRSRMAEMMKAGEWIAASKQMVNLRLIGGETAPTIGVWIAGRVPGWLLLTAPPWKNRLLQDDRLQRLAAGLAWLPAKTKAARVRRTKHARVWGWARVLGPGPKPKLQSCQFRAGPSMPVKSPDKRRCKFARVWEWAWVLGPELSLMPPCVTV